MNQINKLYAGVNGYDPYKINVTEPSFAWVKYVAVVLMAVAIRFLCCA